VLELCRKCSEQDDKIIRAMDEGQSPIREQGHLGQNPSILIFNLPDTNCYPESREAPTSAEIFLVD
jgi:hypothetical protein